MKIRKLIPVLGLAAVMSITACGQTRQAAVQPQNETAAAIIESANKIQVQEPKEVELPPLTEKQPEPEMAEVKEEPLQVEANITPNNEEKEEKEQSEELHYDEYGITCAYDTNITIKDKDDKEIFKREGSQAPEYDEEIVLRTGDYDQDGEELTYIQLKGGQYTVYADKGQLELYEGEEGGVTVNADEGITITNYSMNRFAIATDKSKTTEISMWQSYEDDTRAAYAKVDGEVVQMLDNKSYRSEMKSEFKTDKNPLELIMDRFLLSFKSPIPQTTEIEISTGEKVAIQNTKQASGIDCGENTRPWGLYRD